ncbi:MAG: NADH-quinone oxidoreductase subunit J [Bacteroides sp.]|nr:MAG: NADH-quinone oxidoreductase subunit J [Bacteroides sp.]
MHYLYLFISLLTIIASLGVILSINPIYSVINFVLFSFFITCHYLFLNAQFLGISNIIIYAGSIMILFLFIIMFLNLNFINIKYYIIYNKIYIGISVFFIIFLKYLLFTIINSNKYIYISYENDIGYPKQLGLLLFDQFILPFGLTAILFFISIIGIIILTKH